MLRRMCALLAVGCCCKFCQLQCTTYCPPRSGPWSWLISLSFITPALTSPTSPSPRAPRRSLASLPPLGTGAAVQGGHQRPRLPHQPPSTPCCLPPSLPSTYACPLTTSQARELLSKGDVSAVASLLGRQYRLVVSFDTSVLQSTAHCRPLATSGNGNGNGAPAPSSPSPPQHADEVHYQVVLPSCAFLNQPPACGLYDASLAVAPRPDDDDSGIASFGSAGGPIGAAAAAGGAASILGGGLSGGVCRIPSAVLPLELESGAGMPLTVQIAPDGLYLPNEALRVAMSSAVQHRPDGPLPRTMYAVIDLGRLITLH